MQESDSIAIKLVGQATWDRLLKECTTPASFNYAKCGPPRRLQIFGGLTYLMLCMWVPSKFFLGARTCFYIYMQGQQDLAPAVCLAVGGLKLLVSRASKEGHCVTVRYA